MKTKILRVISRFFHKKSRRYGAVVLLVALIIQPFYPLIPLYKKVEANDEIKSSNKEALFVNVNPDFKVEFGEKTDETKHHIRFESAASKENPFSTQSSQQISLNDDRLAQKIKDKLSSSLAIFEKKQRGIEFSLERAGVEEVGNKMPINEIERSKEKESAINSSPGESISNFQFPISNEMSNDQGQKSKISVLDIKFFVRTWKLGIRNYISVAQAEEENRTNLNVLMDNSSANNNENSATNNDSDSSALSSTPEHNTSAADQNPDQSIDQKIQQEESLLESLKKELRDMVTQVQGENSGTNTNMDSNVDEKSQQVYEKITAAREVFAKTELNKEQDKDTIKNPEVVPGVDVKYQVLEGQGLKEEIVLKERKQFTKECVQDIIQDETKAAQCQLPSNTFTFNLALDEGVVMHQTLGGINKASGASHYFTDQEGNYLFHFMPLFAKDASGSKTNNVKMALQKREGNNYEMKVSVDLNWLLDPARVYPIIIDPSVVHNTKVEFDAGQSFNNVESLDGPKVQLSKNEFKSDANTVALWHMNETREDSCSDGKDVCDSSGNSINGTNTGSTIANGKFGNARSFNGSSNYITVSSALNLSQATPFSFETWIKSNNCAASGTILGDNLVAGDDGKLGFKLTIDGNCKPLWGIDKYGSGWTWVTSSEAISSNQWYHITATFDGTNIKIYVNGEERGTAGMAYSGMTANNKAFFIGEMRGADFFNGQIDEVRISNTIRSAAEIKADALKTPATSGVYTSSVLDMTSSTSVINAIKWQENGVRTGDGETPYSTTGLVAQWNFNETSGTTAASSAGSCGSTCNGTLNNFAAGATAVQDGVADSGWTANNKKWGTGALMFDGSNDSVISGGSWVKGLANVSYSTWIKIPAYPSVNKELMFEQTTAGNYTRLSLTLKTDGTFRMAGRAGTNEPTGNIYYRDSTKKIPIGEWAYLVGIWDSSNSRIQLYLNSQEVSGSYGGTGNVQAFTSNNPSSNPTIGSDAQSNFFLGLLDAMQVYSRALSEGEILSNYQAGNIEIQTRTGNDTTPDDGGWEDWKPSSTGTETQVDAMDSASNWAVDNVYTNKSDSSVIKREGSNALLINANNYSVDPSANYAAGKTYTTSPTPSGSYPDTNLTVGELVDGQLSGGWSDGKSFGFQNVDSSVTLDLGSTVSIDQVKVHFGTGTSAGVWFPSSATVYTSTNGNDYSNEGTLTCPSNSSSEYAGWCVGSFSVTSARYVKVDVVRGGTWTMWSEMQVLNTQSVSDANVVANWHLDETGGSGAYLKDSSSSGNHLTPSGTTTADGMANKARNFNGSSDYLEKSSPANIPSGGADRTIAAWIKPSNLNPGGAIVSFGDGANGGQEFILQLAYASGSYYLFTDGVNSNNNITISGSEIPPANQWSHMAFTLSNNNWKYYLNGVNMKSGTFGTTINTATVSAVRIGQRVDSSVASAPFPGIVDEVKILNISASDQSLAESYRLGRERRISRAISTVDMSNKTKVPFYVAADKPGTILDATIGESAYANYETDANTKGLWHLDEQSGVYVNDYSGNSNQGSITGTSSMAGKIGLARKFTGTGDFVSFGDVLDNVTAGTDKKFSMEAWVKPNSSTMTGNVILVKNADSNCGQNQRQYSLGVSTGGKVNFYWSGLTANHGRIVLGSTPITNTNQWYHIVINYDGTIDSNDGLDRVTIYVNGKKDTTTLDYSAGALVDSEIQDGSAYLGIGNQLGVSASTCGNFPWIGLIDEVRISNDVRTASEIRQAYEIGQRTHSVTVDFAASLDSGNLITSSGDTSFTINSQTYGATNKGDNLYAGDKIIIKENYNGTEYLAQGTVADVNVSTGAVNVVSWDGDSTFPSVGYSANATVFKWQREYFDIGNIPADQRNAITQLTLRSTDGSVGRNIYIDDIEATSNYLTDPNTTCNNPSTQNRYIQYRAILSTSDPQVLPYLSSFNLNYFTPFNNDKSLLMRHGKWFAPGGAKQPFWWSSRNASMCP